MASQLDFKAWCGNPESVAIVVPTESLFGFLRRTHEVPAGFVAYLPAAGSGSQVVRAGDEISSGRSKEVVFVRDEPLQLAMEFDSLPAADNYLCRATVSIRLCVVTEGGELACLCDQILGSRQSADSQDVASFLRACVLEGLQRFVQGKPAGDLVEGRCGNHCAGVISENLKGPCFSAGLNVIGEPVVLFESPGYGEVQVARERAARELSEHEAKSGLREALAKAQAKKLSHLESMLDRLSGLAAASPNVELPELMRAFEESQRAQLYEALFASRPRSRVTRWLVVAAGHGLLFYDSEGLESPARVLTIEGDAGPLRSVQVADGYGETPVLLLGAARGVYALPVDGSKPEHVYVFDPGRELRGGVNAVAGNATHVVASHSEQGVICWEKGKMDAPAFLFSGVTESAKAVRNVQYAEGRLWCTVDHQVVSVSADDVHEEPTVFNAGSATITSLAVGSQGCYVGDAEGRITFWPLADRDSPVVLHQGSRRPAESVTLVVNSGIPCLFFTDTSLAVFSQVVGDSFACRYEATGQTIRRAEVAGDIVAGTADARDRLIVWSPDRPSQPKAVLQIMRETQRSIQDACLVPLA